MARIGKGRKRDNIPNVPYRLGRDQESSGWAGKDPGRGGSEAVF